MQLQRAFRSFAKSCCVDWIISEPIDRILQSAGQVDNAAFIDDSGLISGSLCSPAHSRQTPREPDWFLRPSAHSQEPASGDGAGAANSITSKGR